jgi:hypothetical protein
MNTKRRRRLRVTLKQHTEFIALAALVPLSQSMALLIIDMAVNVLRIFIISYMATIPIN